MSAVDGRLAVLYNPHALRATKKDRHLQHQPSFTSSQPWRIRRLLPFLAALLLLVPAPLQPGLAAETEKVTEERVKIELRRLEELTGENPELKDQLAKTYNEALAWLQVADWWSQQAAQFTSADAPLGDEPELLEDPAAPTPTAPIAVPAGTTVLQAEQEAARAHAAFEAAQERVAELEAEPARRTDRRSTVNEEILRVRGVLIETIDALRAPPNPDTNSALRSARSLLLLAKRQAFQQELRRYQEELASFDATAGNIPQELDDAKAALRRAEKRAEVWRTYASEQRRRDAELDTIRAEQSSQEAESLPPALEAIAAENAELANLRSGPNGLTARLDRVTTELAAMQKTLTVLRTDFSTIRAKVDAAGLTSAMGLLLRRHYDELPSRRTILNRTRVRQSVVADAQYQLILLEEERKAEPDVETQVREALQGLNPKRSEFAALERTAAEYIERRRNLRSTLITEYTTYIDRSLELNAVGRRLAELLDEYRDYIEARIFWVRSVGRRPTLRPGVIVEAAQWLANPKAWTTIGTNIVGQAQASIPALAAFAVLGLLIAPMRRWCSTRLQQAGENVRSAQTDSAMLTVRAFGLTLLHSSGLPLLMLIVSWILTAPSRQPDLAIDVSAALRYTALLWWTVEFARQVLPEHGLADAHYGWSKDALPPLRRNLLLLAAVAVPSAIVTLTMEFQEKEMYSDSLGRVAFLVALAALAAFSWRVGRRDGPLYHLLRADSADSRWERHWGLLGALAVAVPAGLIALTLLGYYYTAQQLTLRLHNSAVLLWVLAVLNGLLLRWLFVTRRQLALEEARKKRDARLAKLREEGEEEDEGETPPPIAEDELDIPALDAQTRQLFRSAIAITLVVGLYAIWASILPALNRLDQVQVWPEFAIVDSQQRESPASEPPWATAQAAQKADSAAPGSTSSGPSIPGPSSALLNDVQDVTSDPLPRTVTLADVGLALVIGILTFAATRNLPSLLEIAFLQRLPLDRGARYAITTIVRYLILLIGITATFGAVGIGWSSIQWLAAALTFGLAFGLQEIFANFVSGIIILAERPMRVGDTVTVGTISGTVSRIRMRATTITDWDRKELIVPNKQFITDQLVNWSLSDSSLRLVVRVGIAYGSDTDKAKRLILEAAAGIKHILQDPPPKAFFLEFGDSSLNIDVHVFIATIEERHPARDQLHTAIKKAFAENDLEIAFPQRDLHIRSSDIPLPGMHFVDPPDDPAASTDDAAD